MNYFVVADVHSFYDELQIALFNNKFDETNKEHVLVVCGDLFDRGSKSVDTFNFVEKLAKENRLIYIRGNHEDLLFEAMEDLRLKNKNISHHVHNGTFKTISDLTNINIYDILSNTFDYSSLLSRITPILDFITNNCVDYYEIDDYIFVHGWIPTIVNQTKLSDYNPPLIADFPDGSWNEARWYNGMDFWNRGSRIDGKTIVCGHWHTNYGHSKIDYKCSEWGPDAIFDPFIHDGIIALDACTAYSKKINCIVIER